MAGIKWSENKFNNNLEKLAREYPDATRQAALELGAGIIRDATNGGDGVPTVPKLSGFLRMTGTEDVFLASSFRSVRLQVGWNTPYAARLHEGKTTWNWTTSGTGPHWLSDRLIRFRDKYVERWGRAVHRRIGIT